MPHPTYFVLEVWKEDNIHIITNADDHLGRFTRPEAEDWANYFRQCGFGASLVVSHYQNHPRVKN